MGKSTHALLSIPVFGRIILIIYRFFVTFKYISRRLCYYCKWLFVSKETTNFTYDLEDSNKHYLAALISDITKMDNKNIMGYIEEIENDEILRDHIRKRTIKNKENFRADKEVNFGRRIGWYAIARAIKPGIIIETGVDKGLGSCILTAALMKNKEEGYEGRYYGTDINPSAGFLFTGHYADHGTILYGDSIESLKKFEGMIDLFINDSDHATDYEAKEYEIITGKLSGKAIILSDNAHCSEELLKYSVKTNRAFIFFQEKPLRHWYPGAGIGISFIRK